MVKILAGYSCYECLDLQIKTLLGQTTKKPTFQIALWSQWVIKHREDRTEMPWSESR